MMQKKFTKLIGTQYQDFLDFQKSGQITAQEARLIPTLKTGDEGALTSIFLSSIKLVREYRGSILKEIKLRRSAKMRYFTEVVFKDIGENSRIDGLIMTLSKGMIKDAIIFEMKNKTTRVGKEQIEKYIDLCKKIGVSKMATVSNEFVSNSSQSPVQAKLPKGFSLYHFSWTYLMTKGQLLLFKNDKNIQDEDQLEVMREVLHYFESPSSGIKDYHVMKPGWKESNYKITNKVNLKASDSFVEEAIASWHEEEKNMALLLSRKLGTLVKSTTRDKSSKNEDTNRLIKKKELLGNLSIKNAVSDVKIKLFFESRSVSMAVKITPPLNKGRVARITWLRKQISVLKKKNTLMFSAIEEDIMIQANIKHAKNPTKISLNEFEVLLKKSKGKDIQAFHVVLVSKFGAGFGSRKKFIDLIEKMLLGYYDIVVQHLTSWKRPAPKLAATPAEPEQAATASDRP